MIYIDPPYNTGNDFIYEDDFAESTEEFFERSNQVSEEGERLIANPESNGRFHSDWLSMMYSRLRLAKNLLSEDGVIFISIDDSEVHNLRKICDEIFGEKNNLGVIVWKKKTNGNNMGFIPPVHDYFLAYGKKVSERSLLGFPLSEEFLARTYSNPDNDPRGAWTTSDLSANHEGPYFEIMNPDTGDVFLPPRGRYWVFNQEEVQRRIDDGRIIFGRSGTGRPVQKRFLSERASMRRKAESWWDDHGMNEDGTLEMSELLGMKVFSHPKPTITLKHLANITTKESDIVLDFFAGSSTTAHAVMKLNAEDGGNRKFIMMQLPEVVAEKSIAFKAGYSTIAEVSKERIRRAGQKILEEHADKEGIENLDIGFRVLKVDSSNMTDVYYKPEEYKQEDLLDLADNIKADRSAEDLLFQVMLDWGLELSLPIETKQIDNKEVFYVLDNTLIACFDSLTDDLVNAIAQDAPLRFVSAEKFIQADHDKTNIIERFKQLSPNTEVKFI